MNSEGGISEHRQTRVSKQSAIRHYLRLSSRRFAASLFSVISFDILSKERAAAAIGLRCRFAPHLTSMIGQLTREDVESALARRDDRLEAIRAGNIVPPPSPPDAATAFFEAARKGMREMWFSNEERAVFRRQALSLQIAKGCPTLFLSVSFHISMCFTVSVYCGHDPSQQITKSAARQLACENPSAATRYFQRMLSILIDAIIGFDVASERPYKRGGAFGHVDRFLLCPEPNAGGNLHIHGLLWVIGAPVRGISINEFETSLEYITSILSADFPLLRNQPALCPCGGPVEPLPLPQEASQRGCRERVIPLASCLSCQRSLTSKEIVSPNAPLFSQDQVEELLMNPVALISAFEANPDRTEELYSLILQCCQEHYPSHTDSCFKYGSKCRFGFPRETSVLPSRFSENALILQRHLGSNWLNTHCRSIGMGLLCNHDLRFCLTSDSFYTLKYPMKNQQIHDSLSALAAIDRRLQRENANDSYATRGRGRILSLVYNQSNSMEVPSQIANFYLDQNRGIVWSHSIHKFLLIQAISMVQRDAYEVLLVPDHNDPLMYRVRCAFTLYLNRPEEEYHLSYFHWAHIYDTLGKPHNRTVILDIIGPLLPDLQSENDPESVERYYLILLVLFLPSTSLEAYKTHSTFQQTFLSTNLLSDTHVNTYIKNTEYYYETRNARPITRPVALDHINPENGDNNANDVDADNVDADATTTGDQSNLFLPAEFNSSLDMDMPISSESFPTLDHDTVIEVSVSAHEFELALQDAITAAWDERQSSGTDDSIPLLGLPHDLRVSLISNAIQQNWRSDSSPYPSLEDICDRFSLNRLQRVAFFLIGRYLLSRCLPTSHSSDIEQLRMFLGGEGGTGKSRVIAALTELAKSWSIFSAVKLTASTGVAAAQIGGGTIHAFCGWTRNPRRRQLDQELTESELARSSGVLLLILDEVGMIGSAFLGGTVNPALQRLFTSEAPFGGLGIVLCGDFAQLPPTADIPIYIPPFGRYADKIDVVAGHALWRSITTIVILEENMRAVNDPTFASILKRLRTGHPTLEDVDILNTRFLPTLCPPNAVIITPYNKRRHQLERHRLSMLGPECRIFRINAILRPHTPHLFKKGDDKTEGLPTVFYAHVGMSVMLTKNKSPKKKDWVPLGLANGTNGTIHSFDFPPDTEFELVSDRSEEPFLNVWIPSKSPNAIWCCFPNASRLACLPAHITQPLYRLEKHQQTVSSVAIIQFPLIPSSVRSVHRVQGNTFDILIIDSFYIDSPGFRYTPEKTSLYVSISRCRSLSGLILHQPLTLEMIQSRFTPPQSLFQEENRLQQLHNATLLRFNSTETTTSTSSTSSTLSSNLFS